MGRDIRGWPMTDHVLPMGGDSAKAAPTSPRQGQVISYPQLLQLTGQHLGEYDVPCPVCGPERRSAVNRRRTVLRVWRITPTFATYRCARCDVQGYAREDGAP